MPRFLLILILAPVAIVLVAALLIPLLLDEQKLLEVASTIVEEETGAILQVEGEINLSLFPRISLDLNDTSITMPDEQEANIRARFLGIGLELLPLLSGRVEAGEMAIDGLVMTLKQAPEQPALDTSKLTDEQLDEYYANRRPPEHHGPLIGPDQRRRAARQVDHEQPQGSVLSETRQPGHFDDVIWWFGPIREHRGSPARWNRRRGIADPLADAQPGGAGGRGR